MYFNKSERTFLQISLLTAVSIISGGQGFTVTPDNDTTININSQEKGCKVSKDKLSWRDKLKLQPNSRVDITFNCPKPQDFFKVEIMRKIACTSTLCDPIIQSDFGSKGLLKFNHTFIWTCKPDLRKSFQINFAKTGLRQIVPTDSCPNKHTYTLRAANVLLGKYCLTGTISSATILGQGSFSLDLPAGQEPNRSQFDVSVGEEIKTIAKVSVTLQEGSLSSTLLTPNYPDSFPDDDVMEWYFQVPNKYKVAIKFLNLRQPSCLKKETEVEYRSKRRKEVFPPDKVPSEQIQGSFSLKLRSCQMDMQRSVSNGLSMNLTVSASASSLDASLKIVVSVVAALVVIFIIVLLVVYIVIKKKKRELSTDVSVYNPGNTNVQPGPNNDSSTKSHAS